MYGLSSALVRLFVAVPRGFLALFLILFALPMAKLPPACFICVVLSSAVGSVPAFGAGGRG